MRGICDIRSELQASAQPRTTAAIYDILARITTGDPLSQIEDEPEQVHKQSSVIILCKEDDPGIMYRPWQEAAGADMRRVHIIEVARKSRNKEDIELLGRLDNTVADLEGIICDVGDFRALPADPITDLAGDISFYKEDQVRRLLGPVG